MTPRMCGDSGGRNKAGAPCGANLAPNALLCVHHDPAQADEMARRRAKGNASRALVPTTAARAALYGVRAAALTLEEEPDYMAWVQDEVASGRMDPRVGHELGYVSARKTEALNKRDLLREIVKLRAELAAARKEAPKPVLGIARG